MRSPELLTDRHAAYLADPTDGSLVGFRFALAGSGRERLVAAIALNEASGPWLLTAAGVVTDRHGYGIADPDGTFIGRDGVWVHRLVVALAVEDTRGL